MRKISFAVASVATIVCCSMGVLAPAANASSTYWGAIAVAQDGTIGKAWDYRWRSDAESAALSSCGYSDCRVLTSFTACGAVAHSWGAGMYNGGYGPNRSSAENAASVYTDSYVVASVCN